MFNAANSSSIGVIQEAETKVEVTGTNLLWNVDCSLSSSELGAFEHSWAVCGSNTQYKLDIIIITLVSLNAKMN